MVTASICIYCGLTTLEHGKYHSEDDSETDSDTDSEDEERKRRLERIAEEEAEAEDTRKYLEELAIKDMEFRRCNGLRSRDETAEKYKKMGLADYAAIESFKRHYF